jgi:hypothetical protein
MKWIVAIAMGLTSISPAALAEDVGQAPAAKPEADKDLICRREAPTGTRFAKRICVRRIDAEKRSDKDQADMREQMSTPQINPPSSGG